MTNTRALKGTALWLSRLPRRREVFPIKAGGPITALEWDGPVLRVAQSVMRGGKAQISAFAVAQLEPPIGLSEDEPEACGQRLAKTLAELKIKRGVTVMGVPRGLIFLRTLLLPKPQTPEELVAMVYFQIAKDLPFRVEDAVLDFQVNEAMSAPVPVADKDNTDGQSVAEKVEVLVAVVKREIVQFYERVATAAGLKLAVLGLDAYANARSLKLGGVNTTECVVALVSLRYQEVVIDFIAGGLLVFSRTAAFAQGVPGEPAEPGATAAVSLDQISIEVVRSLHNFSGLRQHEKVGKILVTGEHPQSAAVVEALAQRCQVPCRLLDPLAVLGVSPSVSTPPSSARDAGALTVLSLALLAQEDRPWAFDFLHPKRPAAPRNLRRLRMLGGAALAAVLLLTTWGVRAHMMSQRTAIREQVAAELESAAKHRTAYRKLRLHSKTVHDWSQEKREWLDHFAHLSAVLPDCSDVYITSISTGARGVLHLTLQARSGDVLADIDKRLRAAGYDLKPLAVTPGSDRHGYPFQSSLELTLPNTMRIDLAGLKAAPRPADDSWGKSEPARVAAAPVSSEVAPDASEPDRRSRRRERQ